MEQLTRTMMELIASEVCGRAIDPSMPPLDEAAAARLAEYNSEAARFERLRAERDQRLAATDYLLMEDYPLDDTRKEAVRLYRQSLRDLPSQEGAPWDGGGEATPWPELPACATYSRT